jgi:hypothetical protein
MQFFGRLKRSKQGVGSIIGAVFVILILLSGLTFYATYLSITDDYYETLGSMGDLGWSQNQERIVIKQVTLTAANSLNLTVENQGAVQSRLIWIGVFNKSAVPESQAYYALDEHLNPSEKLNIVTNFTVVQGLKYAIQLVTELGNTIQNVFYPASEVRCALSLTVASPTTYEGNNVTVMLTATHNDTEVDTIQSLTASISATPNGLIQLVDNSPLTVNGLTRGGSAFFWWVYNTIDTGTVVFNATYSPASAGTYALANVNILASVGQGGGNVSIAGTNSTATYNPSSWNQLGSTLVSGSLTDLKSNDATYMNLQSYVSASSATANTLAYIAYRDSTTSLNTPKNRTWDGSSWGSGQTELPTSGSPVRFVRQALYPISDLSYYRIVVTLSDDGNLDAYVWNGIQWSVTNDIGNCGITANAYRCFDVAFEKTTGDALLVYSIAPSSDFRIGYKNWTISAGWSSEFTYVMASGTAQTAYWICAASKPTSGANEIAVGVVGDLTNLDVYGLIWNGNVFSSQQLLTGTVSIATRECIAVDYERSSGHTVFVSATSTNAFSWQWNSSAWDTSATTFDLTGASTPNWFTLKANPVNDAMLCVSVDVDPDLNTAYWNGSAWTLHTEHDNNVDTASQRCADFAWEPTGSKGLLVWGTSTGSISYSNYTVPNTFGTITPVTMAGGLHPWVQLRTNPRSISGDLKILGAVLTGTVFDIGAIRWDGTTFTVIGTNTISSDTTVMTYECFDLDFMVFGPPTEFTAQAEFSGTSKLQSWTQLVWAIDSSLTVTGVTATFQLYNFTPYGGYPTSGDGYITNNTIGTTDVTKTQAITINPAQFRDANGNWRIKIMGVRPTNTPFLMNIDWIELQTTYSATGDTISYGVWQTYSLKATSASGGPIPCAYVSIYANGTYVAFRNATNNTALLSNPAWIYLDATGQYQLEVKSSSESSETFVLYIVVGSIVGQKTVTQEAP